MVADELRETFARVAARGSMRLGVSIPKEQLRERVAVAPPPTQLPPPKRVAAAVAPTPAPAPLPARLTRRAVSLGGMESEMQNCDYNMGQMSIDPSALRRAVRRTAVPTQPVALVPRVGTAPIAGYPVMREEDKADWTTYAMIGGLLLVVGGGVYYAKKKRMF